MSHDSQCVRSNHNVSWWSNYSHLVGEGVTHWNHRFLVWDIVYHVNSSKIGWSWMYGAIMMVCWHRYRENASPDHHPKELWHQREHHVARTLVSLQYECYGPWGHPHLEPLQPYKSSPRKISWSKGRSPCGVCTRTDGHLGVDHWYGGGVFRSMMPSWQVQNTSSPSITHFVFGRWKTVTTKSLWSLLTEISEILTCWVGSKAVSMGTVNSLVHETE